MLSERRVWAHSRHPGSSRLSVSCAQDEDDHKGVPPQHILGLGCHLPRHPQGRLVTSAHSQDGSRLAPILTLLAGAG
jgi:hypothetical protein